METFPHLDEPRFGDRPPFETVERRSDLIALPGIAQVELAHEPVLAFAQPLGRELPLRPVLQRPETGLGVVRAHRLHPHDLRADVIVNHIGAQQAHGGERTRARRHENPRDAELFRHHRRVDGARAAERDQPGGGEIDCLLRRLNADLVRHARVDQTHDARRGLARRKTHGPGYAGLQRSFRRAPVERRRPAEQVVGVEKPR